MESYSESYKKAGVDVTAGYKAVELMKSHIARTMTANVLTDIGGFGGLYALDVAGMQQPVLVSGTDGVGTKLKIAFLMDKHTTIGIDCVAMCVNDIICCGAKPQFFLDYIALGKNVPEKVASIVSGVAEGCVQSGCALVGGETAEMPGFYPEDEYDVAGFAVGVVDKSKILNMDSQKEGDVLIAMQSSGVHSNGFSLIRNVFTVNEQNLARHFSDLGTTLGDCLLTPTKIYVNAIQQLLAEVQPKSIAHITGGGFYENIPRMLPDNISVSIEKAALPTPGIFKMIQEVGKIPEHDMYNTFNMGAGLVVAVPKEQADKALEAIAAAGETGYIIGECKTGAKEVELW